ncbi:MAG TPA: hypothetical protein VG168_00745 [Bryobacteraceae bacterium]|jgi:hypothetical protein|nr:hypothetical protein [Bryobacteraceae bacterium]
MESLAPFNQLIQELIGGSLRRHTFRAWEIELLVDLARCGVRRPSRGNMLRRYQKAVQEEFSGGAQAPLRLAEFLDREQARRRQARAN